jgi:ABC-type glycerol-3-phosphate transport system substrate-binding protein
MKSTLSTFQLVVLIIFIFIGIAGVVVFAGFGGTNKEKIPSAVIWGTVPASVVNEVTRIINAEDTVIDVKYEQISPETFRATFVNALAEGGGPDIVLLTDDLLYAEANKLGIIPYTVFTQRDYADTYINAADHFMSATGVLGVPFSIDPIVMYWNRGIFATEGIASPPKSWDELRKMVPQLTRLNDVKGIERSGVALGEVANIKNAKEILATMLMQSGNTITDIDPQTGFVVSTLDKAGPGNSFPAEDVIKFYTYFANPAGDAYSWSRSMPDSRKAFLSGDVAIYFGYVSDYNTLRIENPNLNFDVAPIPQTSDAADMGHVTYGKMTAFSVTRKAKDPMAAYQIIAKLTSASAQKLWVDLTKMPPVRKDLLGEIPSDKYLSTFYRAAIQSQTWFDPDPVYSSIIFRDMVESITTGKMQSSDAISNAKQRLDLLLRGVKS